MKLTSFNCTIELSKDENGYSNNCYIDVNEKGVYISHPYVTQTPEQVMFVTNFVHDFIGIAIGLNARVDGFNRDNHLEQYAPKVSTDDIASEVKPDIASESTDVSAAPQSSHGGSDTIDCDSQLSTSKSEETKVNSEDSLEESTSTEKSSTQICITKVTEEDDW